MGKSIKELLLEKGVVYDVAQHALNIALE